MGHDDNLMVSDRCQSHNLRPTVSPDTTADTLVDLVEDEGWRGIDTRQRRFQCQHEPRRFTTTGNFSHRFERLTGLVLSKTRRDRCR